ncbi:ead/Ea22-like family protein [Pseudomonas aeruginosa]|uniref:ead/Ea22-like family protein n=1 Tax=Pseudomonas aeruginosa TaxID=287 RepID=UPI003890EBC1
MTDHAELRRLAEQASSGNWYGEDSQVLIGKHAVAYCNHKVDAQFIGKANPKTVLAVLDEIDRLKAENDELRRLCSCAKQYDLSMTLRRMIDAVLEGDKP